ncbi:MAG: C_GCAxxG_C_C family protein [Rhodocyclales bacterium]|nr:C_GCAxxG_C_C family protein [Rhodocyclales bacterium]
MSQEFATNVRQSAEAAFSSGLYCAESVVLALAQAQGIESALLPQAATAFCGGMARSCGPCGALTGAMIGLGLALGRSRPEDSVQPAYVATQKLIASFEQEFGARDCHRLLGCDLGTPEGQATFRAQNLGERCARYTGRAAEIAAALIAESEAAAPAA